MAAAHHTLACRCGTLVTFGAVPSGVITLLTDFGVQDPFVGVMKGVVATEAPRTRVVDLCHEIEPQQVLPACYWIERSFEYFPAGTVHVVVVDPGVGSSRAAIAAESNGHWFVAPDNGVLSAVLRRDRHARVRRIDVERWFARVSATFHGRDVFAPIAARLADGQLAFVDVGPAHASPVLLNLPAAVRAAGELHGTIITVDRFGNLISNLNEADVRDAGVAAVELGGARVPIHGTYSDVPPGELVAVVNAFDSLEVARRNGSAAELLGLGAGAAIVALSSGLSPRHER
jgi:hypothetical protein